MWTVPYPLNPFFTGRAKVLNDLRAALKQERSATLTEAADLGDARGVGKTQTAVAYAYRFRDDYKDVFWVRADSEWTLLEDFLALATQLGLQDAIPQAWGETVSRVLQHLSEREGWLLVFDHADRPERLKAWRPRATTGELLFVASTGPGRGHAESRVVELAPLLLEEAIRFLYKRTGRLGNDNAERNAASDIAGLLDCFPLALELAGAYITAHELSFREYLGRLKRAQDTEAGPAAPGEGSRPGLVCAARLTLPEVDQASPRSMEFLRGSAFLGRELMPFDQLASFPDLFGPTLSPILQRAKADHRVLEELLEPLARFSLVRLCHAGHHCTLHARVGQVIRESLDQATRQQLGERTVQLADAALDSSGTNTPSVPGDLLAAHAATLLIRQGLVRSRESGHLLHRLGLLLNGQLGFTAAEGLLREALSVSEGALGNAHLDVAIGWHELGQRYMEENRQAQAEQCFKRSLLVRERALGRTHPDIAGYLHDLGRRYDERGWQTQADQSFARALASREEQLGKQHLEVASYLQVLARRYADLSRPAEADELFKRALAIREQSLGTDDPQVADDVHGLASHYMDTGRYEKADRLFQRALEIGRKSLPPNHPALGAYLQSLGRFYQVRKNYRLAESLYQQALSIRERTAGLDLAGCLNHLGSLYHERGKYTKAEPLLKRCLALARKALPPDHLDLAVCLNNLGALLFARRKYAEAERLYEQALAIREERLAPDHPQLLTTLENYALLLKRLKRHGEAAALEDRAVNIRAKSGEERGPVPLTLTPTPVPVT